MSRLSFLPPSSSGPASDSFLGLRFSAALLTAVTLIGTLSTAHAQWIPDGVRFGSRGDMTVFSGAGRGGIFGWAGYPSLDSEYFIDAGGDTLPGWPGMGLPLVPGNRAWADHESFEPISGLPDGDGGSYVLVAEQWPNTYGIGFLSGQQLYVHRRTARGQVEPGWDAQGVRLETTYLGHRFEWHHQACMITDGHRGVIVAWLDEQQPYSRILLQKISAGGVAQWGEDGVYAQQSADACTLPTLVADGQGGALVFWGRRDGTGVIHVQGQHVLPSGAAEWGPAGHEISTRRFDRMDQAIPADGGWIWAFYVPAIVATSDDLGGALLAWSASEGSDLNVFTTRVAGNGRIVWKQESVTCSAPGEQTDLVSGPSRGGGMVIAWRDARKGVDIGFYAQSVTREGHIRWARDGAVVCADVGRREMLRMCTDGEDAAYFAWLDFGRGYQLFAQRLNQTGVVSQGWGQMGTEISPTAQPWDLPWDQHNRTIDLVGGNDQNVIVGWTDAASGTYAMQLTPRGPASSIRPRGRVEFPAETVSENS